MGLADMSTLDATALGEFSVIEDLDIPADFKARMLKFKALWTEYDPPLGMQYDVESIEFDPIVINQRVNSYFAAMLRGRVNAAVRATSPFYAIGADLDRAAARLAVPVARADGEGDDRFRARVVQAQAGSLTAGTEEAYIARALAAEPSLSDVSVISERPTADDPTTVVTCLSVREEMLPTDAEIERVRKALFAKNVKPVSETLYVRKPDVLDTDYQVQVWLFPGVDQGDTTAAVATALRDLANRLRLLGADHTRSAVNKAARVAGVENVTVVLPAADVKASPRQIVRVNDITVDYAGDDE
jgi:phage-related baseplate assembly protein